MRLLHFAAASARRDWSSWLAGHARSKACSLMMAEWQDLGHGLDGLRQVHSHSERLRLCSLTCGFTARWFGSFAAADQRLTDQRGNRAGSVPSQAIAVSLPLLSQPGHPPTGSHGVRSRPTSPAWSTPPETGRRLRWRASSISGTANR